MTTDLSIACDWLKVEAYDLLKIGNPYVFHTFYLKTLENKTNIVSVPSIYLYANIE